MPDAGQDPSRLNSHAYAKLASVPSQEHRMQLPLRHCKILVCLFESPYLWYANCSTASWYRQFHPVIDGKILLDFPTRSILANNFIKVPLIVGWVYVMKFLWWILRFFIASIQRNNKRINVSWCWYHKGLEDLFPFYPLYRCWSTDHGMHSYF